MASFNELKTAAALRKAAYCEQFEESENGSRDLASMVEALMARGLPPENDSLIFLREEMVHSMRRSNKALGGSLAWENVLRDLGDPCSACRGYGVVMEGPPGNSCSACDGSGLASADAP